MLPKAIYRFNAAPIKLPIATRLKNLQISMETWKTTNSQTNLKKNGPGRIRLPYFSLYYKTSDIEIVRHWHNKRGNTIQLRKDSFFHKWCWENWIVKE